MVMNNIFEISFMIFVAVGMMISLIFKNEILQGAIIFLFGIISITSYRFKRTETNFHHFFLVAGFFIGYLMVVGQGKRLFLGGLFFMGVFLGFLLRKLIKTHLES
ncbi:hypothetical protein CMO90_01925 [Candidatus Woesearchaeota archaeon]|jgi:hypothetical protein|nr:hypothetical protein [Candidatus Woesearchaeota archaeon]|tara:strand:- start:273 stop:587 length:315 start_codon:yes stop_codon:yes gene_type:complete